MEILIAIIFLFIGFVVGYLLNATMNKTQIEAIKTLSDTELKTQIYAVKEQSEKQIADMRSMYEKQIESEREYAKAMLQETKESIRQEMHNTAAEQLAQKQRSLQENNRLQIDALLRPLKEQFVEFKRSVDESKTQSEVNKTEIRSTFENAINLFRKEQEMAVRSLTEQTSRIGADAENLTKALKGENKTQGDWGEMILESMLERSGLRRDEQYFIQENVKDEAGNSYRPDVIVRFPEGKSVIIDSKVSLTAYTEAAATDDENLQNRFMRDHVTSIRRHVDELAAKDYSTLVSGGIGYVLMFVPNEASYIAAMKYDNTLSKYAYDKKIIIISPSNLLMALQLAYNLWQTDKQNKNVAKIVKSANDLYDKVAGFSETFEDIESKITALQKSFATAKGRLYDGTGNIMKRVEDLKALGVNPKKQIKGLENTEN